MPESLTLLLIGTLGSAVVLGGLLAMVNSLRGVFAKEFAISDSGQRGMLAVFVLGLMPALFFGGLLVDQWGLKDGLIYGSILAGFSVACLGISKSFRSLLISSGGVGVAAGLLHIAATAAMPHAILTSDRMNETPAATNFGYVFVGIGWLVIPRLAEILCRSIGYRYSLLIIALLVLSPACIVAVVADGDLPSATKSANLEALFARPFFWLAVVAIFSLYAIESAAVRWVPAYLEQIMSSATWRAFFLFVFCLLFLGSRLAAALLSSPGGFLWLVAIASFLATAMIGNMAGMFHTSGGTIPFLLMAVFLGVVFPTLAGDILFNFPSQPAFALGAICSLGTLGRIAILPVNDYLLGRNKVRTAMGVTVFFGLIVAFPLLVWAILYV